jgi:protein-disulfide isomerase
VGLFCGRAVLTVWRSGIRKGVALTIRLKKRLWLTLGAFILAGAIVTAMPKPASLPTPDKVVSIIRAHFNVPETTKMSAEAFRDSPFPDYYQTTVTVDDGKQKKTTSVFATKDGRYLVLGNLVPLVGGSSQLAPQLRQIFKIPPDAQLTVEPSKSDFPEYSQVTATVTQGSKKQSRNFIVSKDERILVAGSLLPLGTSSERDVLRAIVTENQPSVGPVRAPVTIVEYADLQCPSCAHMHEFLEKQLLPKYGDKVRIVFKEFPLPMHDWSSMAAIANECAYQISPSTFFDFRTRIFASQSAINVTNVRDQMLSLGELAGVDRVKLAACIDSKASLPRVEKGRHEGQLLGVQSTPTFFVNGKILAGAAAPEAFFKMVDEALAASSPHAASRTPPPRPQKGEVAKQ